jgi:hypothetical protein
MIIPGSRFSAQTASSAAKGSVLSPRSPVSHHLVITKAPSPGFHPGMHGGVNGGAVGSGVNNAGGAKEGAKAQARAGLRRSVSAQAARPSRPEKKAGTVSAAFAPPHRTKEGRKAGVGGGALAAALGRSPGGSGGSGNSPWVRHELLGKGKVSLWRTHKDGGAAAQAGAGGGLASPEGGAVAAVAAALMRGSSPLAGNAPPHKLAGGRHEGGAGGGGAHSAREHYVRLSREGAAAGSSRSQATQQRQQHQSGGRMASLGGGAASLDPVYPDGPGECEPPFPTSLLSTQQFLSACPAFSHILTYTLSLSHTHTHTLLPQLQPPVSAARLQPHRGSSTNCRAPLVSHSARYPPPPPLP